MLKYAEQVLNKDMILRVQPDSFNNNLLILSVIPASAAMFMLCI